ncbi:hypothetical protein Krac_3791 [Ktedonobacter racemifer DSM 44963]|uniref:Uncharacterized protein n=2 Tax=Ktedonobacter racemifer TaxID=363277 RepID=D6U304_KTERA|nr:hypothetical protein Krac_3791 [Ktedonobacter racemifer DSM 44963]
MFLTQYCGHNEHIIDRIKDYLYQMEKTHQYEGYEHYNTMVSKRSGAHLSALAGAILSTQALATIVGAVRLVLDHQIVICVLAVVIETSLILVTANHLRDR